MDTLFHLSPHTPIVFLVGRCTQWFGVVYDTFNFHVRPHFKLTYRTVYGSIFVNHAVMITVKCTLPIALGHFTFETTRSNSV